MDKYTLRNLAGLALGALLASACNQETTPAGASVSGTATYRERMALPPDAVFEVRLEDVSRADAAAEVIAETRVESPGNPPFAFTLDYDPARIDPRHRYAIRARVLSGDELMFTSDTHTPLPTGDVPAPIEILMVRAAGTPAAAVAAGGTTVLRGAYSYMADAGLFTACGSDERIPVAMAADNAALESAYLKARPEPGAAMIATVVGRVEPREPMEGAVRPHLVVEQFVNIANGTCDTPPVLALEDTYWQLAQLGDAPVTLAPGQRAPHIVLRSADHRVSGYAGCNRMMGGYSVDGAKLGFTQLAGTMMACAQGMDIEQGLHAGLAKVTNWKIEGERLDLLDAGGAVVAAFTSK